MILKLKWAALDESKSPAATSAAYKKHVNKAKLQTYKAFKKKGSNRSSTKAI